MRGFRNSLLFVVILLVAGVAFHYGTHRELGFLFWTVKKDAETGKVALVRPDPKSPLGHGDPMGDVLGDAGAGASSGGAKGSAPVIHDPASKGMVKDPNLLALFDGKTLGKWEPIEFGGEGEVQVNEHGAIEVDFGAIMTGVRWTGKLPRTLNYEISLDAMLLDGNDFFCGLTFPVKDSHASFIMGGWGGGVVGISSVDDLDASENETMNIEGFEKDVWYKVRIRVTDEKIEAWIDDKQMVDLELRDRKISLRAGDIEMCVPLGICSYVTRAQYRNIQWRNLPEKKEAVAEGVGAAAEEGAEAPSGGSDE